MLYTAETIITRGLSIQAAAPARASSVPWSTCRSSSGCRWSPKSRQVRMETLQRLACDLDRLPSSYALRKAQWRTHMPPCCMPCPLARPLALVLLTPMPMQCAATIWGLSVPECYSLTAVDSPCSHPSGSPVALPCPAESCNTADWWTGMFLGRTQATPFCAPRRTKAHMFKRL